MRWRIGRGHARPPAPDAEMRRQRSRALFSHEAFSPVRLRTQACRPPESRRPIRRGSAARQVCEAAPNPRLNHCRAHVEPPTCVKRRERANGMSGDIGHLQRLTDEQVASRLKAYSDGGRFQDSLRWLWGQAGDVIEECSRRHFGEEAVKLNRAYFTEVDRPSLGPRRRRAAASTCTSGKRERAGIRRRSRQHGARRHRRVRGSLRGQDGGQA